ncbi:uncharacterized protein BCR38DRAFT_204402 [Pseudomassariella vexata]|uniref:4'-phosphopantetheinyl transferase domain-containing protein n=1 Tax=Pseudomassariella vexata TaxID=1141098 RepID=A0A1Y2DY46_9PEZI|nr:uncharacterized protein BCR38DRAFT_204402 [Pseudomassariella vexata]ORY64024.1 hypothetical protein BCR38DRAFT_204402 [Pseudomassariella vexata]
MRNAMLFWLLFLECAYYRPLNWPGNQKQPRRRQRRQSRMHPVAQLICILWRSVVSKQHSRIRRRRGEVGQLRNKPKGLARRPFRALASKHWSKVSPARSITNVPLYEPIRLSVSHSNDECIIAPLLSFAIETSKGVDSKLVERKGAFEVGETQCPYSGFQRHNH